MGLVFVFKLSIYLLTGFVGLALGIAERGPIPFLSLPITAFAFWWCEVGSDRHPGRLNGLNEFTARILGTLALLAATWEFFGNNPEGKLLSGIHLVVYLTWVVLLQQKSVYRYWLLMTLGMMHIAVGSVLTSATWYGLCLAIYLFGAIWTLSIFSMFRVAQEFGAIEPGEIILPVPDPSSTPTGQVLNAVRFADNASWISMRLVSGVMLTSSLGFVVGTAFFVLIPRFWVGNALGISDDSLPSSLRRNTTGQMTEIRLGDMRPILESNDPVLSIRLYNNQTSELIDPQSFAQQLGHAEPLFRGTVLTEYSQGNWRPEREWTWDKIPARPDDKAFREAVPTVRQEIRLERIGTNVLYHLGRIVAMCDSLEGVRCGLILPNSIIIRRDWFEALSGPVNYLAYSEIPSSNPRPTPALLGNSIMVAKYLQRCRTTPDLPRLTELSKQLVQAEEQAAGKSLTDEQKARLLERYLRDSGQYSYSLTAQVSDSRIDPVEDFVFNRRAGHCQYFASALGLMLRSVGISARLVSGFKGGEPQDDGSLNVEKRFAHVWVEAWIDDQRWITLDATPEDGRDESVTQIGTKRSLWSSLKSRLAGIWEANVLDITLERQEDAIYQPLRDQFNSVVQFGRNFWKSPRTSLMEMFAFLIDPRNWLTVPGVITLSALVSLLWVIRRKTSWFRFRRKGAAKAHHVHHRRVEFYERFVHVMQSHGISRADDQTQAEFIGEIANRLSSQVTATRLDLGLRSIGDLFYLVRFGEGELTPQQEYEINDLLTQLESNLKPGTGLALQLA